MLQHNWALIEPNTELGGCVAFFIHDGSGVFDQIRFPSIEEATRALRRNNFKRYSEEKETERFISPPKPPFSETQHPNGPIYSSGRFWR
jgi:hypothetical protein